MLPGANVMGSRGMAPLPEGFPGARIARQWRNTHTNDGVPNYKNSRHASARAAVSRAFVRLQARGLLKRDPNVYGVWLTVKGVQAAKELSVNRDDNRTSVSRYRLAEITR